MIELTYFVHNTSKDNERKVISGQNHSELSKKGINQANELKNLISNQNFDYVFCSDLNRALQTANIVFPNKEIIIDKRLCECDYGKYTLSPKSFLDKNITYYIHNNFENGESFKDVEKRVSSLLKYLLTNYNNKKIAIVSHRFPQLSLDVLLNNISWTDAINNDWRNTGDWKPGWKYTIKDNLW